MLKRAFIAAIALSIITSPLANAHAVFSNSNPAKDSIIKAAAMPKIISLTFDDNLIKIAGKNVSKFSVKKPDGTLMHLGSLRLAKHIISAQVLDKTFAPGKYVINYRVISDDGHPVTGTINFTLTK